MLILGCDPGVTGALVLVDDELRRVVDLLDMPTVPHGKHCMVDGLAVIRWLEAAPFDVAIVELTSSMPGWGIATATQLGRMSGAIEALILTQERALLHTTPVAWKRRAGLQGKPKEASMALARARLSWPAGALELAKHHGRAEAALVALFGRAPAAAPKPPKRSRPVMERMAANAPPGPLFGVT